MYPNRLLYQYERNNSIIPQDKSEKVADLLLTPYRYVWGKKIAIINKKRLVLLKPTIVHKLASTIVAFCMGFFCFITLPITFAGYQLARTSLSYKACSKIHLKKVHNI